MDTLNNAIENLMTSSNKEDWPSVNMNVADATVTVISEKVSRIGHGVGLWVTVISRETPTHSRGLTSGGWGAGGGVVMLNCE